MNWYLPIRTAAIAALAVGLTATLTGCSGERGESSGTASASASASSTPKARGNDVFSTPPADIEQAEAGCTNGKAVIDASNKEVTLADDCTEVTISASNAVVHLGDVERLTVSGAINDVDAKRIGKAVVSGNGNRITSDNAPAKTDQGDENLFVTR